MPSIPGFIAQGLIAFGRFGDPKTKADLFMIITDAHSFPR